MMTSPFGSSETEKNATFLALLRQSADETEAEISDISIHFTGGPVIAVGNSKQIKTDSIIAVMLAIVLIVALLFYVFRSIYLLSSYLLFGVGCLLWVFCHVFISRFLLSSLAYHPLL